MEALRVAPNTGSFVPLAEHQSTTPASFHSGPPVLYYYSDRCKVVVLEDELQNAPVLSNFVAKALAPAHSNEPQQPEETNGDQGAQKTLEDVDIWVTSEYVLPLLTQNPSNKFQQTPPLLHFPLGRHLNPLPNYLPPRNPIPPHTLSNRTPIPRSLHATHPFSP